MGIFPTAFGREREEIEKQFKANGLGQDELNRALVVHRQNWADRVAEAKKNMAPESFAGNVGGNIATAAVELGNEIHEAAEEGLLTSDP